MAANAETTAHDLRAMLELAALTPAERRSLRMPIEVEMNALRITALSLREILAGVIERDGQALADARIILSLKEVPR
jgi:hypothetical protein